jgi:probable HAF family extracellular repeat protein
VIFKGGEVIDLGTLGGSYSFATGINDLGQVVGISQLTTGGVHAFLWEQGQLTDIGEFAPGDINNQGQVACQMSVRPGQRHACRWQAGTLTDLGGFDSGAYGINQRGDVLGTARTACSAEHGHLWRDGTSIDLGSFGGQCVYSGGRGLNDRGEVVGNSQTGSNPYSLPFVWRDGVLVDLSTRGLTPLDKLTAINNAGVIVGIHAIHAAVFLPV